MLPPEEGRVVRIEDVARTAGVSVSTVSKVLNGKYRFRQEVIARVQAVVQELGYCPNRAAAQMGSMGMRHRAATGIPIAAIFEKPPGFRAPRAGASVIRDWQKAAEEMGFQFNWLEKDDYQSDAHLDRVLEARGVEGLVLLHHPFSLEWKLRWERYFVIASGGRMQENPTFRSVQEDVFHSVTTLWDHAYAQGYRRIGCATQQHPKAVYDDRLRFGASYSGLLYHPNSKSIPPYVGTIQHGEEGFWKWFQKWRPDAVLVFNVSLYHRLIRAGVRVPKDVGVGLIQGSPKSFQLHGLTCMDMRGEELIRTSLTLLQEQIRLGARGRPKDPYSVLIRPSLIVGRTL